MTITITDAVGTTLEAAAALNPVPGYVNGDDYSDWYIPATPPLLRALAQLARSQGASDLADSLDRFSHPLCMEPVDTVLAPGVMPEQWCGAPVEKEGEPCERHTPEHAAELGRCNWAGSADGRICRSARRPGGDRCEVHAAYCRAVKVDGTVCDRSNCRHPKHRRASVPASC
ncbi:hypothetical protein ACFWGI_06605 [Streptomyces niveus]|uniref:hypothetical protein n=1 Tax=Streptomyces niveus TaxID=193462 RepID=UPI0036613A87